MAEARQSSLVRALAAIPRWHADVDIAGYFNRKGAAMPKVRVWILTKTEENQAVVAAHVAAHNATSKYGAAAEAAKRDEDLLTDLKACEAVFRAFRDIDDPMYPAFQSPEWIRDNLTTDEIATLLAVYLSCKQQAGPLPADTDDDRIDALRQSCCGDVVGTMPELSFAPYPKPLLSTIAVIAMRRWQDDREELSALRAELAELRAEASAVAIQ